MGLGYRLLYEDMWFRPMVVINLYKIIKKLEFLNYYRPFTLARQDLRERERERERKRGGRVSDKRDETLRKSRYLQGWTMFGEMIRDDISENCKLLMIGDRTQVRRKL